VNIKDPKILAGGALLLGALFWFYIKPNYVDAAPPVVYTEEQIAEAHRPTVVLGRAADPKTGVESPGLVLNLKAPASSPNYVKAVIALEFADPKHTYVGVTAAPALEAKNAAFAEELAPSMHKILDAVTSVFGDKTVDEISTTEGRDQLKQNLIEAINAELNDQTVESVYFETFITQ